jgi:predicted nucleic acid-binding protein
MIVADTSALLSLEAADCLDLVLVEFDVHTTTVVRAELERTGEYADDHGIAAREVLERSDRFTFHEVDDPIETSRIDLGEGSCVRLADRLDAEFLLTDDLRALPELQRATAARVAISPIVLRALVDRNVLEREDARRRIDRLAESRSWLGAPIYRRAKRLFEE